jgi:polysaccharide biosynthesis/export protein
MSITFTRPCRRGQTLLACLFMLVPCAALCQSTPGRSPDAQSSDVTASATPLPADYVIGADDLLSIVFWKEPDLSSNRVRVRPDGRISLPLLRDIRAAGCTPEQLREQLETAARSFVADANATVMVVEINSRSFFVTGSVGRPGGFRLNGPMTVLQAIALAGGFSESADKAHVEVISGEAGRSTRLRFNYDRVVKGKSADVSIRPGDTIVVR